ncbi:MAG: hypothetical protein IJH67_04950 [Thermoguttaceae bacterium]|nr:hypothetical protein [Thermoguttaceae bacterium]
MRKIEKETYARILEHGTDAERLLSSIGDELSRTERYNSRALREVVSGIKTAIWNFKASVYVTAKIRNEMLTAPLQEKK